MDYAEEVYKRLKNEGIRVELDDRNEKIGYKIREARQEDKVPYMIIIGVQEVESKTVSVRSRDTDQTVSMTLDEFADKVKKEITERV